ncbi:hypothetical protein Poli38472_001279 [Pythium oligandrum]|uniref:Uncharacterized protein n=1 Tax=Pythium oligandrum TaxID=41045 RepID=A0A8K1CUC9_PYTOL|nr:hypothetical protein Poli38472_001279 [Pythium oligandrum]|eukprot:TMW69123.1 hypothetical protein Poli38472_001279 [Pythium oligandrum]
MATQDPYKPMLKEEDAWRIALAWREPLQECVRLVSPYRIVPKNRIVPTYEWVAYHVLRHDGRQALLEQLHAFKAASTAWFALSCCRGYSGSEDPWFWKRVFGKLREPRLPSTKQSVPQFKFADELQHPVTDAVRFFDEDRGLVFPRIQLFDPHSIPEHIQDALLESFFLGQADLTPTMVATERELARYVDELTMYMVPSRTKRTIPVALSPFMFYNSQRMLVRLVNLPMEPIVTSIQPGSVCHPAYVVHALEYLDARKEDLASLEELRTFGQANPIEVSSVFLPTQQSTAVAPLFKIVFGMDPSVRVQVRHGHCEAFGPTCYHSEHTWSALPHARSFESLTLRFSDSFMSALKCAWIGYALFHPDSLTSSWSELELQVNTLLMEDVERVEAMAMGNNFIAVEEYRTPLSSAYFTADIRRESVIQVDPQPDGELLLITSEEQSVDLVPLDGEGGIELSGWVCVIVPAYGKGWTHASNILGFTVRTPSVASLKSLTIDSKKTSSAVLLRLLALIGSNLRYLDIGSMRPLDSEALSLVLQYCPSLESLRVRHDGSFWAEDKCDLLIGPQLKNLALFLPREKRPRSMGLFRFSMTGVQPAPASRPPRLSTFRVPSASATKTVLGDLQTLRLEAHALADFQQNRSAIQEMIHRLPRLESFHFHVEQAASKKPNARLCYSDERAFSWAMLGFPEQKPRPGETTLSFLSVVCHPNKRGCAVQRLDQDAVQLILQFALSCRLDVWIDQEEQ